MLDTSPFAAAVRAVPVPLDLSVALVAAHGRPQTHAASIIRELDEMASTCAASDPSGLCVELFGSGRFRGDAVDYYDPRNSLLDEVFDRGVGIPITLSVLAIEIGRRLGLGLVGVGMPGHFLVRERDDPDRFFDPFHGGIALDRVGCQRMFDGMHRGQLAFQAGMLSPTPTLAVVARVLNNLRGASQRIGDRNGTARALELSCVLPGAGVPERAELARTYAGLGRFLDAATVHDELVVLDPERSDQHARAALGLRAQLN